MGVKRNHKQQMLTQKYHRRLVTFKMFQYRHRTTKKVNILWPDKILFWLAKLTIYKVRKYGNVTRYQNMIHRLQQRFLNVVFLPIITDSTRKMVIFSRFKLKIPPLKDSSPRSPRLNIEVGTSKEHISESRLFPPRRISKNGLIS